MPVTEDTETALMAPWLDHIADVVDTHDWCHVRWCGGEIELRVNPADIPQVLTLLRGDRQAAFNQLIDLTAVDYPEREARFDVVYLMLSMNNNMRMRLVAAVAEGPSHSVGDQSVSVGQLGGTRSLGYVWDFLFRTPGSAALADRLRL